MNAFKVLEAKAGLIKLMQTLSGQQAVIDGAPKSPPKQVTAWVQLGDFEVSNYAMGGVYEMRIHLIVSFGYVVKGAPAEAESDVASRFAEFTESVIKNRITSVSGNSVTVARCLDGSVDAMDLPLIVAMPSDYLMMAGQETRVYPVGVPVRLRANISG